MEIQIYQPQVLLPVKTEKDTLNIVCIKNDTRDVKKHIASLLIKCALGLGVDLSEELLELLVSDITEVYGYDSIEDVALALKNGRQGKYGKVYGKINMVVISEWMGYHLDRKAQEREKEIQNQKVDEYELPAVDYEAYKLRELAKEEKEQAKKHTIEDIKKEAEYYLNEGNRDTRK